MSKIAKQYYIIDFDSTFIKVEALEELAAISLTEKKEKAVILEQIRQLTDDGIDGKISFTDGLRARLELIKAHADHLPKLIKQLKKKISTSILRNKDFFQEHAGQIYLVSAGFREFIVPIVKAYGIPADRVFANTFEFDKKGRIIGFDEKNLLSFPDGKQQQLKALNLDGEIFVVGDGYSDYLMTEGLAEVKFFAFTENIERVSARENADHVTPSFDEFLYHNNLPMAISYPKNRIKVLLLENVHSNARELLLEEGYQVELLPHSLPEAELCEAIRDVSIIGIRSKTKLTPKVLSHAERLIAVGAFCIGTNQIDLEACQEKGVAVFNAPFSNTRSVVELVIGEIILLMRGIPDKNHKMHQGIWDKSATNSNEIRGKTLGIIGYGNIGAQLSVLAESMGMKVLYFDKVDKLFLGNAIRCSSMKELLRKSDVVTLHVDGDPLNRDIFGAAEFKQMKAGALFLNLSRGFVVDVDALAEGLKSGRIRGAAVDVYPKEPRSNDEPFESELVGLPNLILTPHIGGSTQEAQEDIARYVPEKLINYVNTGNTFASVNFPNLQLPAQKEAHRLIHIHFNQPGILAKINQILSEHGCNIVGQHLKTNESI
ncbi:MAG TPA: phosphoglycerate dehydrogenase, partial [Bacteroidetes bacterium]|nr:phosphoglycerate dehydrogenase [Bacteroidota bacterium]